MSFSPAAWSYRSVSPNPLAGFWGHFEAGEREGGREGRRNEKKERDG